MVIVPSLSVQGFISTPSDMIRKLLLYYYSTLGYDSATYGYVGGIKDVRFNVTDTQQTVSDITAGLNKLLQPYFKYVDINIIVTPVSDTVFKVSLSITCTDSNGNKSNLSDTFTSSNLNEKFNTLLSDVTNIIS